MRIKATWVGGGYPYPKRWARIKDMPAFNAWVNPVRVAFRFETVYVAMDQENKVLMPDGAWLPCFEFWLNGFGRVIGPQDMACGDNSPMAEAWRNACINRRMEQMTVKTSN